MTQSHENTHKATILAIDDEPANLKLLMTILTEQGYQVHPAKTGELGLQFVKRTLPDVVLVDVRMPGMDGYEVCARLKDDPSTRAIPVIFISSIDHSIDKVKAFRCGAVDYVTKPLDTGEVLARIETHVSLHRLRENLESVVRERTAELRKSEERWRSVFENSAIGVVLTDLNSRFLATNHAYQTMMGYTEEELRALNSLDVTHEDYREANWALITELVEGKRREFQIEKKYCRKDGSFIWVSNNVSLVPGTERVPRFLMSLSEDITERKRAEQALQRSESYLAEAQRLSHTGSFGWSIPSRELVWSEETFRIFQYDRTTKPTAELVLQRVHPEDAALVKQTIERAAVDGKDFEHEYRLLMPDGSVKYLHVVAYAIRAESGTIEFIGAATDITAMKQAEEKIREQEIEVRQILGLAPQQIIVQGPDGRTRLYANQAALDYYGLTLEEWLSSDPRNVYFPGDLERMTSEVQSKFLSGSPHEAEARLRRKDGQYRWFLFRRSPLRDEQGRITRWYLAVTDIEDRKQAEERLQRENVALREEIDNASMFEEIVGTSPVLQSVLSRVSKVAATDSSVLITGETGTGKELVARAIHRRSKRSSRAFVSVNCAAIPRDLIASELFGHEKGAFTGATQQRLGRFELAEGGTIFLDEVGEIPSETQVALLRVLQEHEFERVGGSRSIQTDVRVIGATNRDLEAAIAAGTFRSDLFYRLNVFPIEIPSLRERREDVPLLVEYFIYRYARKAGKRIRGINKNTLDLLLSYPWPGNIRELQNVIERSVILCETENFSVDESWLSRQPPASEPITRLDLYKDLPSHEKEIIEEALNESRGRVDGPSGAAAKLGMPRSTLESKIRTLKINKNRFKITEPSTDN